MSVGRGGVNVGVGRGRPGGAAVDSGPAKTYVGYHGKPVVVYVPGYCHPYWHPYCPFDYRYAATDTQLRENGDVALFFLEKDLHRGAKMKLHFVKAAPTTAFVPRGAAESIPFSSDKLPEILERFSVKPGSVEASAMNQTLKACEDPAAAGETRYCATSLESMVDFATASLGTREVQVASTEAGEGATPEQIYSVTDDAARLGAGKKVACHARPYAYPVFYCHVARSSRAYLVPLVGENGAKVEAVVVCHADTSGWNPRHVAFKLLKVKPGTVPICHFLPQDHVIWAPRG